MLLFQSWGRNIRSPRVTTWDGCRAPLKGHGSKTNNESRAVLPPLQKEGKKKKALESSRGSVGFFCYFSSEQKCWQGERWNYISYSCSGTRPQAKKGNVLLNVTYWKTESKEVVKEKRGGREGEERENEKKGKEEIKACYWTDTNDWLRMEKWSSLEGRLSEICGMLDFQLWLLFLYNKECISGFSGFSWNSPDRTDAHSITHFTSRLWTALFGMKIPEKWHVYTLTGNTVDYQNDLWERLACLGLGQVYGMSIWGGGWGVTDPHNVRAQPGEKLEPQIVPNGKTGAEWWAEST